MDPSFAPFAAHAYIEAGLDRADPLRNDVTALAALWPQARVLVLDAQGRAAVAADGGPCWRSTDGLAADAVSALFLGIDTADGLARFAVRDASCDGAVPVIELRDAASQWPAVEAARYAYARAMLLWQQRMRFCPQCGGALALRRSGFVALCPACDSEHYPRVDPAVIVAVSNGDHLLMGRSPGWAPRRYSVIAGFVEPGETLEQTVCREVREETCIQVEMASCRYLGSQPWPFPGALMLGFAARGQGEPQVDGELEDARWISRAEVALALEGRHPAIDLPPPLSIARSLIAHWHASGS